MFLLLIGQALLLDCPLTAARRVDTRAVLVVLLSERACRVVRQPAGQVPVGVRLVEGRVVAWRVLAWRVLAWRVLAWRVVAWRVVAWRVVAWRGV